MILVTGGAGYIGSVTVELFRQRGEQVVILDNLSRGHSEVIARDRPFYQGNTGNRDLVARITSEHDIEACIHSAALGDVRESVAAPARYRQHNGERRIALSGPLLSAGR